MSSQKQYLIIVFAALSLCGLCISLAHMKKLEPRFSGRPVTEWLHNAAVQGTNRLTLEQMLTLKRVVNDEDRDIASFELPIKYEALTNIGTLFLWVDSFQKDGITDGIFPHQSFEKATNGNCLVEWNITYDPPGPHRVQAQPYIKGQKSKSDFQTILGPALQFYSSNVCQFDESPEHFDSRGAILFAKVFESNTAFGIEIKTESGKHIKTMTGKTTNGEIEVFWDLTDDNGVKATNLDQVNAVFRVTNSFSGASTLKLSRLLEQ